MAKKKTKCITLITSISDQISLQTTKYGWEQTTDSYKIFVVSALCQGMEVKSTGPLMDLINTKLTDK